MNATHYWAKYAKGGEDDGSEAGGLGRGMGTALGAAGGLSLGAGAVLAMRPGLRAHLYQNIRGIGRGGARAREAAAKLDDGALETADEILASLKARGVDPSKARIAVVGTGGTGKSTMRRALQERGKLDGIDLDLHNTGVEAAKGRGLTKYFAKQKGGNIAEGTVAEQTHLLSQVSPDKFDAIVHLRRNTSDIHDDLLKRRRGAWQRDYYDYDKVDRSVRTGVQSAGGDKVLESGIASLYVPKPGGRFAGDADLANQLKSKGLPVTGDRMRDIQTLAEGRAARSGSPMNYMRLGRMAGDASLVAGGGILGGLGANQVMKKSKDTTDETEAEGMKLLNAVEKRASDGSSVKIRRVDTGDGGFNEYAQEVLDARGRARARAAFKAMSEDERREVTDHIPVSSAVTGGSLGGSLGALVGALAISEKDLRSSAAKKTPGRAYLRVMRRPALGLGAGMAAGSAIGYTLGDKEREKRVRTGTFEDRPDTVTGARALSKLYEKQEAADVEKEFAKAASDSVLLMGLYGWSRGL